MSYKQKQKLFDSKIKKVSYKALWCCLVCCSYVLLLNNCAGLRRGRIRAWPGLDLVGQTAKTFQRQLACRFALQMILDILTWTRQMGTMSAAFCRRAR